MVQPVHLTDTALDAQQPATTSDSTAPANTTLLNNNMVWIDPRVSTPLDTPAPTPTNNNNNINNNINKFFSAPFHHNTTRNNSNTSLASSINSDFGYSNSNNVNLFNSSDNFTPAFMKLLLSTYQDVSTDPRITPFDTTNPPSGILNKVSKLAIETALQKNIDIGYEFSHHLVTMVRHCLLLEVRKDGYLSRNTSTDFFNSTIAPTMPSNNNIINSNINTPTCNTTNTNILQPKYFNDLIYNNITNNNNNNIMGMPNGTGVGLLPVQELNTNSNNNNSNNNTSTMADANKFGNKFPLQRNIIRSRSNTFDKLLQPLPNTLLHLQTSSSTSNTSLVAPPNNAHLLHLSRPNTSSPLSNKSSNNLITSRTNSRNNSNNNINNININRNKF